jgi:hypothetical protein
MILRSSIKKGKQNAVADALSRKDEYVEAFLYDMLIILPDWIIEARDEWKNDKKVWTLIQRLQQDSTASYTFTWKNDSLWYKYRLYLCKNSQLKQKVLLELHTSPVGGHSGFLKTYHRVKKDFFWDGLKIDVQRFVAECLVCQQNKVETIKTPGILETFIGHNLIMRSKLSMVIVVGKLLTRRICCYTHGEVLK